MRASIVGVRIAVIALACYWLLLSIGTHIPRQLVESIHAHDKILHFSAFAGLAFLLAWAIPTNPNRWWSNVALALACAIVYAGIDELTQIPVGRTADWQDFYADAFGSAAGLVIYLISRKLFVAAGFGLR